MQIKSKKYTLLDFILLPFCSAPVGMSITIIHRLLNALIPSFQVIVTADFVDTAINIFNGKLTKEDIIPPLLWIMAIIAYQYLSWSINSIVDMRINIQLSEELRPAIVEKRSKLSYQHIENNDTWELITRTCSDPVGKIMGGADKVAGTADMVIRVISLLTIVMAQVWWAALIIIAFSVPLFFLSMKGGKNNYEATKEATKYQRRADYLGGVLTGRDNIEERTLFSYSEDLNKKWFDKYETARKINHRAQLKNFIRMKSASMMTILICMLIVAVLLQPLQSGTITIGMFMALVSATFSLVNTMSWQLSWVTSELAKGWEYLKDLTEFSKLSEQDEATALPEKLSDFNLERIEFRNVTFRYPGTDRDILKNCSFTLDSRLHYAFVGVNGAGKTTITKLLTGMYDNYEGEILINGFSLRSFSFSRLKSLFSVVYQDFAKYYIPFKDNILLGNVRIQDEARMKEAMEQIELLRVAENLPQGTDTYLGKIKENGVDLSGGEWQRLAIARSLYGSAKLHILDEPTAALDPVAESRIYEMFGDISRGKSTIFITHRLGAARLADEILVIDEGKVAEQGDHEGLIKLDGIYAKMFASQKGWYEDEE